MTFPWIAIVYFKIAWNQNRDSLPKKNSWQDPIKFISSIYKHGEDAINDDDNRLRKTLIRISPYLYPLGSCH
jgi:hypothetical protein